MNILCVCTGNTCRSPMLAALLRDRFARMGRADVHVESAGTGAYPGEPATPDAVACMAERGIDLSAHRSRLLDQVDLAAVDHVFCMTSGHAAFVRSQGVPANKLSVVNAAKGGVPDPFGRDRAAYEACARTLAAAAAIMAEVLDEVQSVRAEVATAPAGDGANADQFAAARAALDRAHAADPERRDGRPAEALYADQVESWIARLITGPGPALRLAARCQHLERWAIPRGEFPLDRAGYLAWRRAMHTRQGKRATELLLGAGTATELAARVGQLVAKASPRGDAEGQALEDAACLVFLEHELAGFADEHPDYTREKFIDIIRKTWRKMSPQAHQLAATIPLPPALQELVKAAIAS